jgi:hypothetical protein
VPRTSHRVSRACWPQEYTRQPRRQQSPSARGPRFVENSHVRAASLTRPLPPPKFTRRHPVSLVGARGLLRSARKSCTRDELPPRIGATWPPCSLRQIRSPGTRAGPRACSSNRAEQERGSNRSATPAPIALPYGLDEAASGTGLLGRPRPWCPVKRPRFDGTTTPRPLTGDAAALSEGLALGHDLSREMMGEREATVAPWASYPLGLRPQPSWVCWGFCRPRPGRAGLRTAPWPRHHPSGN